jgi:hypothetical protein
MGCVGVSTKPGQGHDPLRRKSLLVSIVTYEYAKATAAVWFGDTLVSRVDDMPQGLVKRDQADARTSGGERWTSDCRASPQTGASP